MSEVEKEQKKPETNNKTDDEKTELVSCVLCGFGGVLFAILIFILQSEEDKLLQEELSLCVERLLVSFIDLQ